MTTYLNEQYKDLDKIALEYRDKYMQGDPFPNITFDNFFDAEFLSTVLSEFPDLSSKNAETYDNPREIKLAGRGERFFGNETKLLMHYLNSEPFLNFLQVLTGIKEPIFSDPYFVGAGQHEIKPGGLLKIHADFNKHNISGLDRRLNVLVYLNKDWKEEYGGHFELWDKDMKHCVKKILPTFNTMAIFSTTSHSYHGHPNPLTCPEGMSRKSLALYYYSNGRPKHEVIENLKQHTTIFKKRGDNADDQIAFSHTDRITFKSFIKGITPPFIWNGLRKLRS